MYAVLTLLSLLGLAVAGQVVWIYVSEGPELEERARRQVNSRVEIPALRGAIYDRAGRALAINTARYELALDPTVDGFAEQSASFFEKLSALTGTPASAYQRKVRRRSSPKYVRLLRNLSEEQKEEVAAWDAPGVILTPRFVRRYNYDRTAGHLLGYISADEHGLAGLERRYDEYLKGTPGWRAVQRDRRGQIRAYVGGKVVEPRHGQSLVLTIDLIRQTVMEEELQRGVEESKARWGTAIAMDPHTGEILGLANVPDYDPNRPGAFADAARRNRAVTDRLEPGSTFKLVTAVAALEQGAIDLQDSVETGEGWAVFRGRTMHDTHAHGTIPFIDVIAQSSNIGTAKTASRLDRGVFYQYARNLGFNQPTGIDLPGEVGGRLKKPTQWSGTSLTSMAIGYEVAVTPLQLLTAYSALANGGLLVRPHVVAERRSVTGRTLWRSEPDSIRRAFERETAQRLLPAFERVVDEGTAERAQIKGLRVAGKTGTAKKAMGGQYRPGKYRATFVGFFPAEDPEVALIVVLDEPETSIYGGAVAAPIFQRIARRWARTFPKVARRIAPEPGDSLQAPPLAGADLANAPAPDEQEGRSATHPVARRANVQEAAVGGRARPEAPTRLVRAVRDTSAILMPDLRGLSARQAVYRLGQHGVAVQVEGRGAVARQQPEPGDPLPERVILHCQ